MDPDERYIMNEESRMEAEEFRCPYCLEWITGRAAIDPILDEDDEPVCDHCAADLVNLQS